MTTTTTPRTRAVHSHPLLASPVAAATWITGQALGPVLFTTGLSGIALTLTAPTGTASNLWFLSLVLAVYALTWLQGRAFAAAAMRTPGALAVITHQDLQDGPPLDPVAVQLARLIVTAARTAAIVAAAHWTIGLPGLDQPLTDDPETITAGVVIAATLVTVGLLGIAQAGRDLLHDLRPPRTEHRPVAVIAALIRTAGGLTLILVSHHSLDPTQREDVRTLALISVTLAALVYAAIRLWAWSEGRGVSLSRPRMPTAVTTVMDRTADEAVTWWKGAATLDDRARYRPLFKAAAVVLLLVLAAGLLILPKIALVVIIVVGGIAWGYSIWRRRA